MPKPLRYLVWPALAALGAWASWVLASSRSEPVNSASLLIAAACTWAIGYRFYSKWIAVRTLMLDDRRATPAEVHDDGRDFVKTNKWIVFGHHFAAISGPGPLVGPVLAAQFGYLPGALWILIGVVLGGAVQGFVILVGSMRRDGKSLAQMVREEISPLAGVVGAVAILAIMIILLAVLGLVVVNALAESPWGVFTVAMTIPIAMFMGGYLRCLRAGRVLEVSVIGVVLLLLAVLGGQWGSEHAVLREAFHLRAPPLAWLVIAYSFAASVLPVWLLLAPRDYLSTFMKIGTILLLALGVLLVLPQLQMPPVSRFVDGSGPVVPGKLFPFAFITIACGAISGFHALISSGVTPKIIARERHARAVGYAGMQLEALVGLMAMIAACTLEPGVYLAMNLRVPGDTPAAIAAATVERVNGFGPEFALTEERMAELAREVKEESLYGRTGGAATLAVGMANLFHRALPGLGEGWMGVWYHFALMFEALFILTTLDSGTRVGRYLLQEVLGRVWRPLGDTRRLGPNLLASGAVVVLWGYFLIAAVHDPDGGIRALWPMFGIANQLLAATALCLATTIILKMTLTRRQKAEGKGQKGTSPWLALVTLVPLLWLVTVTGTAAVQKIWHPDPRIGFHAGAAAAQQKREELRAGLAGLPPEQLAARDRAIAQLARQGFNLRLNAVVTKCFLALVAAIVLISVREWVLLLARKKLAELRETPPVWLPDYVAAEARPLNALGLIALLAPLLRELTGEADFPRTQEWAVPCPCPDPAHVRAAAGDPAAERALWVQAQEERYRQIRRCC